MARVRHQGPEFAVIDKNIGEKIITDADVKGFLAHLKEPELALLKRFEEQGEFEKVRVCYLCVAPCIRIEDPQGDDSTNLFIGPSRVMATSFFDEGELDLLMRMHQLFESSKLTSVNFVDTYLGVNILSLLTQVVQSTCEAHRDKIGDRLGRYPFVLSFMAQRVVPDQGDLDDGKPLGYAFSDEPDLKLPVPESKEVIYPQLPDIDEDDGGMEYLESAVKAVRRVVGDNSKRKKERKTNGKNKRRKK